MTTDRIELLITAKNAASASLRAAAQDVAGLGANVDRANTAMGGAKEQAERLGQALGSSKEKASGLAQGIKGLGAAFAALGVAAMVQQLLSFGTALGQAALGLEKARSTAQLLAGDSARYNEVIAIARQNQILFGGSLQENVQGLASLAGQARKSGIELSTLNDLSQRLNLLSPEQGLEGAAIALREALAGDTTSLVERFELPRLELAKLRDASLTAAQRVEILNKVLEDQGVKAGAVAGTVSRTQQIYNFLGRTLEDLSIVAGDRLAKAFEHVALGLATVIEGATRGAIVVSAFFDALGRGVPIQEAWADANGAGAQRLAEQLGLLPAQTAATNAQTAATNAQTAAIQGQTAAMGQSIAQQEIARVQSQLLAQQQDALRIAAMDAAMGSGSLEAAAARLAGQFPITADEARALVGALRELNPAAVAGAQRLEAQAAQTRHMVDRIGPGSPGKGGATDADIDRVVERQKAAKAEAEALAAANARYIISTETSAERVGRLRRELQTLTQGTAAYRNKQIDILEAEKQLAAERGRGAARASRTVATEAQRLSAIEDRTAEHYRRLQQAQADYELSSSRNREDFERQRLRLLAEGRIKEAQLLAEEFAIKERRSREDFDRQQARSQQEFGGLLGGVAGRTVARTQPGGAVGSAAGAAQGVGAGPGGGPAPTTITVHVIGSVLLDGQKVGDLILPRVEQAIDQSLTLAIETAAINVNQGQSAIRGGRP
jgi:hypothetical protein